MELILVLEPLSQYDAAATPMFNAFTNNLDATPFVHEQAQISLDEKIKRQRMVPTARSRSQSETAD